MAMTISTSGFEELEHMLQRMGDKAQDIAAEALFEGADVIADAFTRAAGSIHAERRRHSEPGGRYPTPEEKEAVQKIGVARFRKDDDGVNTVVGPAKGYTTINGKQKAIQLIARSINSGTSFMKKQPVFRRAATTNRKAAQERIVSKAEELINKTTNGK